MNSSQQVTIKKVALAVFKDKKILMARYRGSKIYYFIGGQVKEGESDTACLVRKVSDEVGASVDTQEVTFLEEFRDKADGRENTDVVIRLYDGRLLGEPIPNNDVEEIRYVDSADDVNVPSAIAVNKVFPWLVSRGLIR